MPSINRIRLVNIQYDKGAKQYADELFKLHGKNTLFNLANGGGKTLWLQLVTQTQIPGANMGSRRMVDLLAHERYTGHILVEWKLDTFGEREFLLTGFCFTKGTEEDGDLKYFTYTHQYKIADEFGIAKLPLVTDGKVIPYQDFYNLLRKEASGSGRKIQTFSQYDRRKYINHLSQFHIYEKEWLSIRTTNGSEGGMDGFFSRSKTEQTLMENLLIPTVDQALFQDEREAQDLAHSFLKYKDKLLRIPAIEKNLIEFQEIEAAGRSVVDKVAGYSESRHSKTTLEGQMVTTKDKLAQMVEERAEEAEALQGVVADLQARIRDEEFKQASLDVNLLRAEYRGMEAKIAALATRLQELVETEQEAEHKVRLHRAIPKFLQIKELEKRLARDQETLAGLDKQNEDLLVEQETYRGQYLTLWTEKRATLQADLEAKKAERLQWKEKEAEADRELVRLNEALSLLNKTAGEIDLWFKQYERQKAAIIELLGDEVIAAPTAERDNLRWQEIELHNGLREGDVQVEKWEQEVEDVQTQIEKARDTLRTSLRDQDKTEAKILEFEGAKGKVLRRLEVLDLAREDLYATRAELELRLTEKREGYVREYGKQAAKKGALEEKQHLLSDSAHYVPSQELLSFQQILADWGIESLLGSQWLQERDAEVRERLVRSHPMLPYALLLGDAELLKLRDPRLDWEGVHLESLIPLLALSALESDQATETAESMRDGQVLSLEGESAFVTFHGGYSPFLSDEALRNRRVKLDAEMAEVVERLDVAEKSRRHIEQVADDLARFYEAYPSNPLPELEKKRDKQMTKVAKIEEEIGNLSERVGLLRGEIAESKKKHKADNETLEALRNKLRLLDPFATLAAEREEKEAERDAQQAKESALKAEQSTWAKVRSEARDQDARLMPAVYSLDTDVSSLDKAKTEYIGTSKVEPLPVEAGLSYDVICGKIESLDGLLAQKSVGREELVRLVQNHEESIKSNWSYLKEVDIFEDELSHFQSAPPQSELEFWENRLKEIRDEHKTSEAERAALLAEQKKLEGKMETEEKKVEKDYKRSPYQFAADIDLAEEQERLKQSLTDLRTQRQSNDTALEDTRTGHDEAKTLLQKVETLLSAYAIEAEGIELGEDRERKLEKDPSSVVNELDKHLQKSSKQSEERRRELEDEFYRFERSIDKYESKIVQKFIRSVIDSKTEGDMYDIEQVRPVFEKCFEMMRMYIEKAHLEREELEEAKEELVHRCLQHAERVYDNLKSIAQYTKIDYRGKKVQAIEIQLADKWEGPSGLRMMSQYLHALTEELQAKVAKGEDEDDIEKWLTIKLSSKHLLNVVAPIGEARIKVFKPQQVGSDKIRYDHWSEIMKWSGGEQYTGCFAMFIAVLSYLRSKMSGIDNASKVLLADNPFGVVSSPHLLQVIFKLAQVNRVQMICLSDHNKQSIYDLFEVVYSLKLTSTLGRSVIQSSERRPESVMEAGFYEIDFDKEVETEQKSLVFE